MSDLRATVHIINQTNVDLRRVHAELKHGKWTDGKEPTQNIGPKGQGVIRSQKRSGAFYGTEGTCVYHLVKNGEAFAKFFISWSLPYAGGTADEAVTAEVGILSYRVSVESKIEALKYQGTDLIGKVTLHENVPKE